MRLLHDHKRFNEEKYSTWTSKEVLHTQIDAAYESKYQRYNATYVDPMIAPQAGATTLKLVLF